MSAPENGYDSAAGNEVADRGWDEVLADAIRVLTDAARLRRPVLQQSTDGGWEPHPRAEPADWAEFITLAVDGAAANVGSVDRALEGRPGSWEADAVRSLLLATVGDYPGELLRHRTEPIRVVLRPAEILALDLGYADAVWRLPRGPAGQQDRHLWRYQLGDDRTWTPLDDWRTRLRRRVRCRCVSGSATRGPAATLGPGTIMTVPRSAEDEAAYDALATGKRPLRTWNTRMTPVPTARHSQPPCSPRPAAGTPASLSRSPSTPMSAPGETTAPTGGRCLRRRSSTPR